MKVLLVISFLLLSTIGWAEEELFCFFIPPEKWEAVDPSKLNRYVRVGFAGKGSGNFRPTINLAIENIGDSSLKSYLKAVKEIHESDKNTLWRDLGKFETAAGCAELTEITTKTQLGELRLLQLILLHDKKAYLMTGGMPTEEFALHRAPILKAFRSLTLTSNLFSTFPNLEKREKLEKAFANLKEVGLNTFQQMVLEEGKEMGLHWQIVVLQEAEKK